MEDKRAGCPTWFLGGVAGLSGERLASSAISSATLSCCAWSNTYSRPNHSPPLVQFSLPSPILILVQSTWLWPTDLLLSEFLKLLGSLLTSLLPVCCAQPSQRGGDCRTVWGRRGGHILFKVLFTTLILQAYTCELVLFCAIHLFRGTVLPFLSATKEMTA